MINFVKSLATPVEGGLNDGNLQLYYGFTEEDFIDDYEDVKEKNPHGLQVLESSHYTVCFLFDLLQFCYMFMIKSAVGKREQEEE